MGVDFSKLFDEEEPNSPSSAPATTINKSPASPIGEAKLIMERPAATATAAPATPIEEAAVDEVLISEPPTTKFIAAPAATEESAATDEVSAVLAGMLQQVALIEQAGTSAEREAQYDALAKMLAAAVPPAQHNLEQVSIPSDEYLHATEVDTPTPNPTANSQWPAAAETDDDESFRAVESVPASSCSSSVDPSIRLSCSSVDNSKATSLRVEEAAAEEEEEEATLKVAPPPSACSNRASAVHFSEDAATINSSSSSSFNSESMRASRSSYGDAGSGSAERLFQELVQTEAEYVADLRTMLSVYARPAQKLSILMKEEKEAIFCNTEQLLLCAEALHDELRKPGELEYVWANAFLTTAPFFKIYGMYAKNYMAALETTRRCRHLRDGFAEFLSSAHARSESKGLLLEDFLIKPVQRLLKYPLFFESFLKGVPADHPHRPLLEKARELVVGISASVNNSQSDGTTMMQALLEQIGPSYLKLLAPHRKLKLKCKCVYTSSAKRFGAMAFLMSDLLLLCERTKGNGLRPHLLAPLRGLLTDDDALDGARGTLAATLIAEPVSQFTIPMRLEAMSTWWAPMPNRGPDSPDSSHRQLSRQGSSGGTGSVPFVGREGSTGRLSRTDSGTGSLPMEDESFRLEFPSAEAKDAMQSGIEDLHAAQMEAEAAARRPERRLTSVYLDEQVKDLCVALTQQRLQESTDSSDKSTPNMGGRRRLTSGLGSAKALFGVKSDAPPSKEELRRSMTGSSIFSDSTSSDHASPRDARTSGRLSVGDNGLDGSGSSRMPTIRRSMGSRSSFGSAAEEVVPLVVGKEAKAARPGDSPVGGRAFERFT